MNNPVFPPEAFALRRFGNRRFRRMHVAMLLRRRVAVDAEKHPAKAGMAEKLATEAGRALYAQRKWLAEAPIGWIKEALGFRRFSLRGLDKVQGEWDLVCLALNVKRMQCLQPT